VLLKFILIKQFEQAAKIFFFFSVDTIIIKKSPSTFWLISIVVTRFYICNSQYICNCQVFFKQLKLNMLKKYNFICTFSLSFALSGGWSQYVSTELCYFSFILLEQTNNRTVLSEDSSKHSLK